VWVFLLRYVPDRAMLIDPGGRADLEVFPVRSSLLQVFAPRAAAVLSFLLVFGPVGGWLLAGRMLAPLTRITDATRVAASGSLSHRIRLPGHTVNARAIDLTEGLLLLSRGDRASFAREPVDLSLVADEAVENLLPLAERRGVTLEVTGGRTRTAGSPALLLRMVTNLVQNAIVHTLPAGGTVTVHTETRHDASVLRVENTGPRLPADLVPTLTEPLQRGTARTRAGEHAGVGLGLAIVHSIVRAHDGALDLASRPAGGLLVTVRLPATRSAAPASASAQAPAPDDARPRERRDVTHRGWDGRRGT